MLWSGGVVPAAEGGGCRGALCTVLQRGAKPVRQPRPADASVADVRGSFLPLSARAQSAVSPHPPRPHLQQAVWQVHKPPNNLWSIYISHLLISLYTLSCSSTLISHPYHHPPSFPVNQFSIRVAVTCIESVGTNASILHIVLKRCSASAVLLK